TTSASRSYEVNQRTERSAGNLSRQYEWVLRHITQTKREIAPKQ
ncbi:MAG: hypothetical protein ACI97R_001377, partial [Candidatus Azotimanducaceae bacterium]